MIVFKKVKVCPSCGANNIQANKNIVLIMFDGVCREYECNICGRIWAEENEVEKNVK